jgi:hypothetical protein
VDAQDALAPLRKQDIRLTQLPRLSVEKLEKVGVKSGQAERIIHAARKFIAA